MAIKIDEELLRTTAERIYNLDAEVYKKTGSSLGRVYNGDKERNIRYIQNLLASQNTDHVLRDEMALIVNMAKTLKNVSEKEYAHIRGEYLAIMGLTKSIADNYTRVDILDASRTGIIAMPINKRFELMENKIITVGRTHGSCGSEIGFSLANELNINYYDVEIFNEVSKRLEVTNTKEMEDGTLVRSDAADTSVYAGKAFDDEKFSLKRMASDFKRFHGLPRADAMFFNQSELIIEMAKRESFVIMGRCANFILTNARIPHISIFVSAPFEQRVRRISNIHPELTINQVKKLVRKVDKFRADEYKRYTGQQWENASNFDLTLNSANYGVNGTVEVILKLFDDKIKVYNKEENE